MNIFRKLMKRWDESIEKADREASEARAEHVREKQAWQSTPEKQAEYRAWIADKPKKLIALQECGRRIVVEGWTEA